MTHEAGAGASFAAKAEAEPEIGAGAQEHGDPVGAEPVRERGQKGRRRVHADEHEHAGQAGLDHPEATGGHRHEPDQPRHGVREQDERRARVGTRGAHAGVQAPVVEEEAPGRQEHGPHPLLPEHPTDEVALVDQALVEALDRRAAAEQRVHGALGHASAPAQRAVGGEHERTERGEQHEPADADERDVRHVARDRRAEDDRREREDREGEQPAHPEEENAVRPPTAVSESMPATDSIRNWTAAPAAAPAGSRSVIALPDSWAVITTNHPFVRNAMRWRANVQQKWAISRTTAAANHTRSRLVRRGQAPRTLMMLGRTK